LFSALGERDYRLLLIGQSVSYAGDQFHLVALPWLVLQLTSDPLQLGFVLATAGLPRALLIVVGGTWADRHSPRAIMLLANVVRFALAGGLAVAILTDTVEMWMVYLVAAGFGTMAGFFIPTTHAAVPRLVSDEHLESGNALLETAYQLSVFLGPAAAGAIIAWFGGATAAGQETASLSGIGVAFAFDAGTFLFAALMLLLMSPMTAAGMTEGERPVAALIDGLRFAWRTVSLRWLLIIISLANMLFIGPLLVGVPTLASTRLAEGAAALGIILSAFGLGNIAGIVVAGSLRKTPARAVGLAIVVLYLLSGAGFCAFALIQSTWSAVPIVLAIGAGNGFLGIALLTLIQRMAPAAMLGRMSGLLMLSIYGLQPISQSLAGAIARVGLDALFLAAGGGLIALGLFAASRREIRHPVLVRTAQDRAGA